mmetsp:Transcript_37877/g.121880  ORF Transcript_37877/g.121880 Transcript_37877/m.121880 type:complete len:329 (+) Transcript_37877:618-1604(+)
MESARTELAQLRTAAAEAEPATPVTTPWRDAPPPMPDAPPPRPCHQPMPTQPPTGRCTQIGHRAGPCMRASGPAPSTSTQVPTPSSQPNPIFTAPPHLHRPTVRARLSHTGRFQAILAGALPASSHSTESLAVASVTSSAPSSTALPVLTGPAPPKGSGLGVVRGGSAAARSGGGVIAVISSSFFSSSGSTLRGAAPPNGFGLPGATDIVRGSSTGTVRFVRLSRGRDGASRSAGAARGSYAAPRIAKRSSVGSGRRGGRSSPPRSPCPLNPGSPPRSANRSPPAGRSPGRGAPSSRAGVRWKRGSLSSSDVSTLRPLPNGLKPAERS